MHFKRAVSSARKLKRQGLTAGQTYERLIEAILSGALPSGGVVREARLARDWKTSRTPLREAMRRAAESGFIVLRPNRAPIVRAMTANDIRDIYGLREVLELYAFRLSWPHLTEEDIRPVAVLAEEAKPRAASNWPKRCLKLDLALHGLWMRRCGNSWLIADLERNYRFLRILQRWIGRDSEHLEQSYLQHIAILDAIQNQDQPKATELLATHIKRAAQMAERNLPKTEAPNR